MIINKTIVVNCEEGNQRILWLAHVALARYDSKHGLELGVPKGIQTDDGELLESNKRIKDKLTDQQHVWVLLKGDEIGETVEDRAKISKDVLETLKQTNLEKIN